ncbi:MAG: hypothetical protein AABX77_01090 [Nanoarchaeota archaeon]
MYIHNYKGRFDRTLEKIKGDKDISKSNKEVINKFKDYHICLGISSFLALTKELKGIANIKPVEDF